MTEPTVAETPRADFTRNIEFSRSTRQSISHSVSGAGAGIVAAFITCPLDVVKTKLQNQKLSSHQKYKGTFRSLSKIWASEGIRGLYRGLGPTMFGYLPTWGIYFGAYNKLKLFFSSHLKTNSSDPWVHVFAAMSAGGFSTFLTNPVWVVKTRFMTQSDTSAYKYHSTWNAFRTILANEGSRGLYRGLVPSLLGSMHVAVQFPIYEKLKIKLRQETGDELTISGILLASGSSKMIACIVTYPHEVIRTQLQTQIIPKVSKIKLGGSCAKSAGFQPKQPITLVGLVKRIYREEGALGFYKGLSPTLLRTVPASAVTILTYEMMLEAFKDWVENG